MSEGPTITWLLCDRDFNVDLNPSTPPSQIYDDVLDSPDLEHLFALSAQELSCSNISWEGIEGLFSGQQGMPDEVNTPDWVSGSENETLSSPENNVDSPKSPEHVTSDDSSLFDIFNQETQLSMAALHSVEFSYDQNKPPLVVAHSEPQNLYEGLLGPSSFSPSAHLLFPPVEQPSCSNIWVYEALEGLSNEEIPVQHEVNTPDWVTVSGDEALALPRNDTYFSESNEQVTSEDNSLFKQEAPLHMVSTGPVESFDNQIELLLSHLENLHEGFPEVPHPSFASKTPLGFVHPQTSLQPTFTFDDSNHHPLLSPTLSPHHQLRPVDLTASPSDNVPHTAPSTSTKRKRSKGEAVDYGVLCESALECLWANCMEQITREGCLDDADYQSKVHDHLQYHQDGFTQDSNGKWLCKWEGCAEKLGSKRALGRHFLSGLHVPIKFFCPDCGKSWSRRSTRDIHVRVNHSSGNGGMEERPQKMQKK